MTPPNVSIMVLVSDGAGAADGAVAATLDCLLASPGQAVEVVLVCGSPAAHHAASGAARSWDDRLRRVHGADGEPWGATLRRGFDATSGRRVGWLRAGDRLQVPVPWDAVEALPAAAALLVPQDATDGAGEAPDHGTDAGAMALLGRMLGGSAPVTGVLLPRDGVVTAGGFSGDSPLPELDLLAGLVPRHPLRQVAAARLHPARPPERAGVADAAAHRGLPAGRSDRAAIADGLLARLPTDGGAPLAERRALVVETHRGFATSPCPALATRLATLMADLIGAGDLTVAVVGGPERSAADLGVPGARVIRAPDDPAGLLTALAASGSAHGVAVDGWHPPPAPLLAAQLLHLVALDGAACFGPQAPGRTAVAASPIVGTLFRTGSLTPALLGRLRAGEGPFWYALQRTGPLVSLPAITDGDRDATPPYGGEAEAAPFIDAAWYRDRYPERSRPDLGPVSHYLSVGWKEGCDPNPWFQTRWYAQANRDEVGDGCPLLHFIRTGGAQGRRPHPHFDLVWYARRHLGAAPSHRALLHFLQSGVAAGAVPEPLLDDPSTRRTLRGLPVAARTGETFARLRESRVRDAVETMTGLVDADWYRVRYPDVAAAQVDPRWHYLHHGWREERSPNPWFDPSWYRRTAMAGEDAGLSPLEHFVVTGAAAGCRPVREFATAWYMERHLGSRHPSAEALRHFLTVGLAAGCAPDAILDGPEMSAVLRRTPPADRLPLIRRLWALRTGACGRVAMVGEADEEDWALLLLRRKPVATGTVLLLLDPGDPHHTVRAAAAAAALPAEETALFMLLHGADRAEIRDRLGDDAVAVGAPLDGAFRLVRALRCTRIAAIDPGLLTGPAGAALRNARLTPVTNRNSL
ncbi:hypothetical protein [Azospirillum sp. ST 5-10]|uniref:hypothetical protein n=1 Tax=unclassified Azospirillum TaxID=2630922 RepID=UPI003F4A0DE0